MGEPAGAATDLLDAWNSECMEELSGTATIVLGNNGGCAAAANDLHDAANSMGAFSLLEVRGIVSAEGHGEAALLSVYLAIHFFVALVVIHCTIMCAFSSCQ